MQSDSKIMKFQEFPGAFPLFPSTPDSYQWFAMKPMGAVVTNFCKKATDSLVTPTEVG